jgi:hypothetical protein
MLLNTINPEFILEPIGDGIIRVIGYMIVEFTTEL